MAEARIGCIGIIKWIWTQVKSQFSYMVENSPDNQVLVDMDASASLPRLPAVMPLNQETMACVPADQMNKVQVLFEKGSGPSNSNHQIISKPTQFDSHPSSSSCLPSSSTATWWKYDVFLSFRGPDTRKGITVDIRDRLQSRGVRTFMDDPDLQEGETISPALKKAIEESRFAVVVF